MPQSDDPVAVVLADEMHAFHRGAENRGVCLVDPALVGGSQILTDTRS